MSDQFSKLSPEVRALLEKRLLKNRAGIVQVPGLSMATLEGPQPLSYSQESLWFLDQLEPNSPLYIIPEAWRITGKLQLDVLQKAFMEVIGRHEALRVHFSILDNQAVQKAQKNWNFQLQLIDLKRVDVEEKNTQLHALLTHEAQKPFHLGQDLLIRGTIIELEPENYVLLVTLHHIISDAYSMGLFYEEISRCYESIVNTQRASLPELPVQYAAFASEQRKRLQGEALEKESAFWLHRLSGELPALEMPSDRKRPAGRSFHGLRTYFHFPETLHQSLKELSRAEGVTLYMTLLAGFATLLHRYSTQEAILIGTPISTRNRKEYENLIGFFINTVVLRTDLSGEPSFREVVQRVRQLAGEAFAHAEMPLYRLVEKLNVPRHTGNPLFQVVFQYLASATTGPRFQGCEVESLPMESGTAKFDLTLTMVGGGEGLTGNLEYNTDLFDSATIDRLLGNLQALLEALVQNPNQSISKISILSEKENAQLSTWNQTATAYPRNSSIQELFEGIVARSPNSTALEFEGTPLTYGELNVRSNQVAHALRKHGVGPDSLVGICVPRSLEMVIGLLGILKAGGAYVPLDPSYPRDRLAYLVSETSMSAILTTQALQKSLFTEAPLPILALDANPELSSESIENPERQSGAENLAYVLYTSGSTGKPKGVAIPHRGVVRLVRETQFMSFSPDDVYLQFAPISFDASTLEIWGSLLNGAKLVIFPAEFKSLQQLGEIIKEKQVTTLWLTAGLFHQMVEEQIDSLKGVRQLLAGGDVLSVPHVLKVLIELPGTQLINGYGPTENTTFTCCFSIPANWAGDRPVPIGKPISNTQAYVLDRNLNPVPIGVPGELFIGGDGLARAYLRAPELTREKFVPSPFGGDSPTLYKTGDITRWLPDGNMEFVGRMDFQVKIRGFRVELGEIENSLSQHPAISEAVVLAKADKAGTKQLVACVVLKELIESSSLRRHLQEILPAHMVPGQFIVMDRFPLNTNGKVDRKQLSMVESNEAEKIKTAPRNVEEQTLANIWAEVLAVNEIGIEDDFFELGGHSLLATKIVSRVNKEFNTNIPLAAIFDHPTVASLAEDIARQRQTGVRGRSIISRRSRPQGEPHDCTTSTH